MTMFNDKLIHQTWEYSVFVLGSVEKPGVAQIFNLGKFRAVELCPRGTPCYSTENAETFVTV